MLKMNMNKLLCYVITIALFSIPWILGDAVHAAEDVRVEGDSYHIETGGSEIALMSASGTYRMPSYRTTYGNVGIIPEFSAKSMDDPCWFSRLMNADGTVTVAYCIEYLTFSSDGDGYDVNTGAAVEHKALLSDALYFGFRDAMSPDSIPTDLQRAQYCATQGLVWTIMRGIYDTPSGDRAVKQLCDGAYRPEEAWQYYLDVKEKINSKNKIPVFASGQPESSPVHSLSWDQGEGCFKGIIKDTSETLRALEFTSDGVQISKDGDSLVLRVENFTVEKIQIKGTKNLGNVPSGSCLIWTNDNLSYQKVASVQGISPVSAYFRVETKGIPGKVVLQKKDKDTGKILTGGEFALYEWDGKQYKPAGYLTDKGDGRYVRDSLLATQANEGKFKVVETKAPKGYFNQGWSQTFTIDQKNREINYVVENKPIYGTIRLIKEDGEAKTAQGDATLEGAVYEVYPKGSEINAGTMVTDNEGRASLEALPLGVYLVKEIQAGEGYLVDEKVYEVCLDSEDDKRPVVEATVYVTEQVIKQPVALLKLSDEKVTPARTLEGVGFRFYLKSTLKERPEGGYDLENAQPVAVTDSGAMEIFTDKDGKAVTCQLPYGVYLVSESTVPEGFLKAADFTVEVRENSDLPQTWLNVVNTSRKQRVKIIKKDANTGETVLKAGAAFKIYDRVRAVYVCQESDCPGEESQSVDVFMTDGTGTLILPEPLPFGKYCLEEVNAPDGYINDGQSVEFEINKAGSYTRDVENPDVLEVEISNQPVKGQIVLKKSGEVLIGFDGEMIYEVLGLPGVKFQIYAGEKICTPDNHENVLFDEGQLVGELETGEEGIAVLDNLPLGEYVIKEILGLPGFIRDTEEHRIRLEYAGQETGVVTAEFEMRNVRGKLNLGVRKVDGDSGKGLEGIRLSLFTKDPLYNSLGEKILDADERVMTVKSSKDGMAEFNMDLPFGTYYVREDQALEGYMLTKETVELDGSVKERTDPYFSLIGVMENKKIPESQPKAVRTGDDLPVLKMLILMAFCGICILFIIVYSIRMERRIKEQPSGLSEKTDHLCSKKGFD